MAAADPLGDDAFRWVARVLGGTRGPTPPPPGIGWDAVGEMIQKARLAGLFLHRAGDVLPPELGATLDESARRDVFALMRTGREQAAVLQALGEAGVEPVVILKGSVLGRLAYPDPMLRPMHDIDVLVREAQARRARAALCELGYREAERFAGRPASRAANHELVFFRELLAGRVRQVVELHVAFAQSFRYRIDYAGVLRRAVPFPEEGPVAHRLAGEDQLLQLAVNMAREQFLGPLKQLLDMHLWIRRGGLDFGSVLARARRWGAATAVWMALRLTDEVFGTDMPSDVREALAPSGARRLLLEWSHRPNPASLLRFPAGARAGQAIGLLPLMDDTAQRVRFLATYGMLRFLDATARRRSRFESPW